MSVYQTHVNAMNDKIERQIAVENPFVFKHILDLKSIDNFDDTGPCVVLASLISRMFDTGKVLSVTGRRMDNMLVDFGQDYHET